MLISEMSRRAKHGRSYYFYTALFSLFNLVLNLMNIIVFMLMGNAMLEAMTLDKLLIILGSIVLTEVLTNIITYLAGRNERLVMTEAETSILSILVCKILYGKTSKSGSKNAGELAAILQNEVPAYTEFFDSFSNFFIVFPTGVIITIVAIMLDWRLCLLSIFLGFIQMFLLEKIQKKLYRDTASLKNTIARNLEIVQKCIESISALRFCHNISRFIQRRYENTNNERYEQELRRDDLNNMRFTLKSIIRGISDVVFLVSGLLMCANSITELGVFLGIYSIRNSFTAPFEAIADFRNAVLQCRVSMGFIREIENIPSEDVCSREEKKVIMDDYAIELDNVVFGYDENRVLNGFNLKVLQNNCVRLSGVSGAGKSTVIKLIERLIMPTYGKLRWFGYDQTELSLWQTRSLITYLPQQPYIFADTIANNISLGNTTANLSEIVEAAKRARIHDFIMTLPQNYSTMLMNNGDHLSAGQRHRICIARAFLRNSPILLLDEITASLDAETEKEIYNSIEDLIRERTVVYISHSENLKLPHDKEIEI